MDVVFLVSGDDDLTEAVEEAQLHGTEVIVPADPKDVAALARPSASSAHSRLAYAGVTGGASRVLPGYDDPAAYAEQIRLRARFWEHYDEANS